MLTIATSTGKDFVIADPQDAADFFLLFDLLPSDADCAAASIADYIDPTIENNRHFAKYRDPLADLAAAAIAADGRAARLRLSHE